jgi:hypothetical protein
VFGHRWNGSLTAAISNCDGVWYLATAAHGYPSHLDPFHYSTVGFFPLYPILMWALGQALSLGHVWSGLIVSLALGAVATILIGRLAERWSARRRAGARSPSSACWVLSSSPAGSSTSGAAQLRPRGRVGVDRRRRRAHDNVRQLPPNQRMLLCAFPLLIVLAAQIEGRAWRRMIYLTSATLIVLSPLTFIAKILRP